MRRRPNFGPPQDTISAQGAVMAKPEGPSPFQENSSGRASHQLVVSFLATGRAIAFLGLFLPASMLVWSLLTGSSIRGSLSEYYYTPVRDLMVGTLMTMAVFLWSYRGFSDRDDDLRADRRVGKVAAVAAVIIAFAPITPRNDDRCTLVQCIIGPQSAAFVHSIGATAFFICLAIFCLVLLPRSVVNSPGALARVRIYLTSGWLIVAACVFIGVWQFLPPEIVFALGHYRPVFWAEAGAIVAFCFAWIVRGRALKAAIQHNYDLSEASVERAAP
ncbi:MAG: hypothetical protein ACTHWA_06240 [Arachnia sp.]